MTGAISEIVTTRAQLIFSLTSILTRESSGNVQGVGFDEMNPSDYAVLSSSVFSLQSWSHKLNPAWPGLFNKAVLTFR